MLLDCFSNIKNLNTESKHDTNGGAWPQTMCPHTSKNRSNAPTKSFRTKQFCISSYTITKRPPKKRHGQWIKTELYASQFNVTYVLGLKSSIKKGHQP